MTSPTTSHHVSFAPVPERVTFNDCKTSAQLRNRFLESGYSLSPTRDISAFDTEADGDKAASPPQPPPRPPTEVASPPTDTRHDDNELSLVNTHSIHSRYGISATEDVEITRPSPSVGLGLVFHDCTVIKVHRASPASRAQMRAGDVVVMINGVKVESYAEVCSRIAQCNGTVVCLTVLKNPPPLPDHLAIANDNDEIPLREGGGEHTERATFHQVNKGSVPTWGSQRQTTIRAGCCILLASLSLIAYLLSTQRDSCEKWISEWIIVNAIVQFLFAIITVLVSKAFMEKCLSRSKDESDRFLKTCALMITAANATWGLALIVILFSNLNASTQNNCGTAFSAARIVVGTTAVVTASVGVHFCALYTNPGDEEDYSRVYRFYDSPRGANKNVGRMAE